MEYPAQPSATLNVTPRATAAKLCRLDDALLCLSMSRGPGSNTSLEPWNVTFEELATKLKKQPRVGKKEGSYFVRGPFIEGQATRADAHISEAALLILDGDKTIDPNTGEMTEGAPAPLLVHEVLRDLDIPHIIYTSWSHKRPGKGNRYRVLIPAAIPDRKTLLACVEWTIAQLHAEGVYLADVKENHNWSQAWYFPRKASAEAEYLAYDHDTIEAFDVAQCIAWKAKQDPFKPEALDVAARGCKARDTTGLFGQFNAKHGDPKMMLATLQAHGYALQPERGTVNGSPAYRLLAPDSTSDAAGVVLFKAKDGRWLVASHHGEHDPLSAAPANDAFDLYCLFEHGGDQKKALTAWKQELDPRPVIRISGGALPRNLKAAIAALSAMNPPELYQRGQTLCRVTHLPETSEVQGCTIPRGTATLIGLQRAGLGVLLGKAARWERFDKKAEDWRECDADPKVTNALLEASGQWGDIPTLLGISESPILRPDGSLHSQAGYDPLTRLYVEGRTPQIDLPSYVSREQAQQAARYLLAPFNEFPFSEPEQDHAALLAYLFTLALRPQLDTSPLFCVSATTPGTGKGLLIEVANMLVRGRDAALMPAIQGAGAEEETRKRITSLLLQGVSSINLDNWTRAIGGEAMNALLTASEWSDRVLGRSEAVTLPARIAMAATGNNISVRGDMTRRSLLIQLDAACERPEKRSFQIKNLPGYVLQHRRELLASLFTILKGYQQAGRPEDSKNALGRFEGWSAAVAAPIRWLGYPCPTQTQDRLREQDPEAERLEALLEAWFRLEPMQWVAVGDLIDVVTDFDALGRMPDAKEQALREALLDVADGARGSINRKKLGWYLKYFEGRIAGGLKLVKKQRRGGQKHANQYRVERVPKQQEEDAQ